MKMDTIHLDAPQGASTAVVALPDKGHANTALPVVVLIHEWWGINDHIRDVASSLCAGEFSVRRARSVSR